VRDDLYTLPEGLPAPEDDGAAEHLTAARVPSLVLESSMGPVDLAELCAERGVLYVYPRTGRPDRPMMDGWNEIPGARGCTPQSCAFRDHAAALAAHGARVAGLSAQNLDDQREVAERNHMPFPVLADPQLRVRDARPPDLRGREPDALQAPRVDRRARPDREGLLPGVPAGPERTGRPRLAR
jgi:peroxiredoxin